MEATPRKRGRAGCVDRERRRALYPICAICEDEGRVTATEEIDHIIPLTKGGPDTDENTRGLCKPCHAEVSRIAVSKRMQRSDGW